MRDDGGHIACQRMPAGDAYGGGTGRHRRVAELGGVDESIVAIAGDVPP